MMLAPICLHSCRISDTERDVRDTIIKYNDYLVDAYSRPDPEIMRPFVSQKEFIRIQQYILYNLTKGQKLIMWPKRLDFKSCNIKEKKASCILKERWIYRMVDKDTGVKKGKDIEIVYKTEYILKKIEAKKDIDESRRWVVKRLNILEKKEWPVEGSIGSK